MAKYVIEGTITVSLDAVDIEQILLNKGFVPTDAGTTRAALEALYKTLREEAARMIRMPIENLADEDYEHNDTDLVTVNDLKYISGTYRFSAKPKLKRTLKTLEG